MKRRYKIIFCSCFFLLFLVVLFNAYAINATENKNNETEGYDLSDYCRRFGYNDNTHYKEGVENNTNNYVIPFDILSKLSLQTESESGNVGLNVVDGDIPTIYVENASLFIFNMSFEDYKSWDTLHKEESEKQLNEWHFKEYKLSYDTWGAIFTEKEKQTIYSNGEYIQTGEIGSGAIIVQTSYDNVNWTKVDSDKYSQGLFNTDIFNAYHGTTQSYYLNGDDIKKGVYVTVSVYYEVEETLKKTVEEKKKILGIIPYWKTEIVEKTYTNYHNISEKYTFYVVEDNPEVITFNNLTTDNSSDIVPVQKPNSSNPYEYHKQNEQYMEYINALTENTSKTMVNNDMSTTGIRINMSANPYLNVDVLKDGKQYDLGDLIVDGDNKYYELLEKGKYNITITAPTKTKNLTLIIDNDSQAVAYERIFGKPVIFNNNIYGDEFLDYSPSNPYNNERILVLKEEIPTFKSSLTLNVERLTNNGFYPLYGTIFNRTINKEYKIYEGEQLIVLDELGEYEVIIYSNPNYYEKEILGIEETEISGDVRVYKFRFKIYNEDTDGTVNNQILATNKFGDMLFSTPSDYLPKFYGVIRNSANKGDVLIAFADYESALNYARRVVWSEIETFYDEDGKPYWKIPNLENPLGAKVISHSGWENAKVVNELSKTMVEEHYFDLTETSSYLTIEKTLSDLDEENIKLENLQFESLTKSVVIWFNEEHRDEALINECKVLDQNVIRIISKQKTASLSPNDKGIYSIINEEIYDFHFISDCLGIDSYTIEATDINGKTIQLKYNVGLYEQLKAGNLASGIVNIVEKTVYGHINSNMYIYYIKEGYQPAKASAYVNGSLIELDNTVKYRIDSFKLEDVSNYIDPHVYIRLTYKYGTTTKINYFKLDEAKDIKFSNTGTYELAIVDRFGNAKIFNFIVE